MYNRSNDFSPPKINHCNRFESSFSSTKYLLIILTERQKRLDNGLAKKMINSPDILLLTLTKPLI